MQKCDLWMCESSCREIILFSLLCDVRDGFVKGICEYRVRSEQEDVYVQ
jgi:hypothetical protein